ncbi:hypothetical protein FHW96_000204 [Novosphingobium sp. SG751A]|uniref:hypothetical protein n=1 Tax=Novosphingobium sp. SG751A TaxID=2587000 RepID=UPI0015553CD6|nr:hypothetical protein [Novosphingobium sp. SG751A]NOW44077.1 hypothetical protein [Novosphingobium sp. SG751A]
MTGAPTCGECRWLSSAMGMAPQRCTRPIGKTFTHAWGEVTIRASKNPTCERARDHSLIMRVEQCGPSARFFEQRPALPPPPQRGK